MDVATDRDLFDFTESLDVKERKEDILPTTQTRVEEEEEEEEEETNIWQGVADALDNWNQRVLDAASRHTTSGNFQKQIEDSIRRQQLDGSHGRDI